MVRIVTQRFALTIYANSLPAAASASRSSEPPQPGLVPMLNMRHIDADDANPAAIEYTFGDAENGLIVSYTGKHVFHAPMLDVS